MTHCFTKQRPTLLERHDRRNSAFSVSLHFAFTFSLPSDLSPRSLQPCIRHSSLCHHWFGSLKMPIVLGDCSGFAQSQGSQPPIGISQHFGSVPSYESLRSPTHREDDRVRHLASVHTAVLWETMDLSVVIVVIARDRNVKRAPVSHYLCTSSKKRSPFLNRRLHRNGR